MAPNLGSYLRPWKNSNSSTLLSELVVKVHIVWEGHEISTIDLSYVSTMEISQNFVAFSEYMNFRSGEQNVCCKKYT